MARFSSAHGRISRRTPTAGSRTIRRGCARERCRCFEGTGGAACLVFAGCAIVVGAMFLPLFQSIVSGGDYKVHLSFARRNGAPGRDAHRTPWLRAAHHRGVARVLVGAQAGARRDLDIGPRDGSEVRDFCSNADPRGRGRTVVGSRVSAALPGPDHTRLAGASPLSGLTRGFILDRCPA